MDKMDQQDLLRRVKTLYKEENFRGILALVRDVDLNRIKDRRCLEMIAESYDRSGLYKDARETLLITYEKFPQSRSVAYNLALISVKLDDLDDAVDYYEDFCKLAPSDNNRYILKYIIGKAGGIELKDLIKMLEQYTSKEMDEKWLYELARMYHEAGMEKECVAACDEITLWYADGEYEKPALELKFMHKALSPSQQARYEQIMSGYVHNAPPADREDEKETEILEEEAETFVSEFFASGPEPEKEPEPVQTAVQASEPEPILKTPQKPAQDVTALDDQDETLVIPREKLVIPEMGETQSEAANEDQKIESIIEEEPERSSDTLMFNKEVLKALARTMNEGGFSEEEEPLPEEEFKEEETEEALPEEETPALEIGKEDIEEEILKEETEAESEEELPEEKPQEEVHQEEEAKEEMLKPEPMTIKEKKIVLSERVAAKLGVKSVEMSPMAMLVTKPSLLRKNVHRIADASENKPFVKEPTLRENVDVSDIPLANEADGQVGINLELIDRNGDDKIEGQLTLDSFFAEYAGKVKDNKDKVAAVEAERLRQVIASVSGMEATPLYDMDFDTPEEHEFKEEDLAKDLEEEFEKALEDNETEESAEVDEELGEETEETADEAVTSEETAEGNADSEEENSDEEAEEAEGSEEGQSEVPEEEPMDEDMAAAIAKFEEAKAEGQLDEEEASDALLGFGDTLADMVSENMAGEEETEKEPEDDGLYHISDELRDELKEFLLTPGMEKEIRDACESLIEKRGFGEYMSGNLIVTGDKKSGKTYLAIAIIKEVIKKLGTGFGKVVKVQAQPLNGKNLEAVFEKVGGRDLIIENVGYLEDETIENLIEVMNSGAVTQMVVLEGNMLAVENILIHFPEIGELFSTRVNIEELTITEWAKIAGDYAKEQGYVIDDMATLALHARIDRINIPTARLGLGDIKDIVDSAIAKASKRNNGRLFAAFSKKGNEEISLTEADFLD